MNQFQVPTRARYWVIVYAVTLAVLSYIDRVAISQAAPAITKDLGLSKTEMGAIFTSFALAYAIFEIPGGWMGDWMGPRRVLLRIVLWWSFFTAATGWMWNFSSMVINRFLFGAGEAGCFPNLTKMFTTWLPAHERVRAQGIMWSFARWGGAFTPPLFVFLFSFMSWRDVFHVFGGLGVVWGFFFYRWYRDNPQDHPSLNDAEKALLADSATTASGHGDVPWRRLISTPSVWLLWAQYFLITYPWYFYITWLPTYLQEHRELSMVESGRYAVFPLLFGGIGCMAAGFFSKTLSGWVGSLDRARRILGVVGFLGGSAFLLLSVVLQDPLYGMIAMGMASFCNDIVMPGAWGACMDIGGKYAGTLSGSMNMMGNAAGIFAPTIGGFIVQRTGGDWNMFLYTMVASYFLGALCWPFINSNRKLEDA